MKKEIMIPEEKKLEIFKQAFNLGILKWEQTFPPKAYNRVYSKISALLTAQKSFEEDYNKHKEAWIKKHVNKLKLEEDSLIRKTLSECEKIYETTKNPEYVRFVLLFLISHKIAVEQICNKQKVECILKIRKIEKQSLKRVAKLCLLDWDNTFAYGNSYNIHCKIVCFLANKEKAFQKNENYSKEEEQLIQDIVLTHKLENDSGIRQLLAEYEEAKISKFDDPTEKLKEATLAIIPTIGKREKWNELLANWIETGGIILLLSFSSLKSAFKPYLKNTIGLNEKILTKVYVADSRIDETSKNPAILRFLEAHPYLKTILKVMCDDYESHLCRAKNEIFKEDPNFIPILATKDGAHLEKLASMITPTVTEWSSLAEEKMAAPRLEATVAFKYRLWGCNLPYPSQYRGSNLKF